MGFPHATVDVPGWWPDIAAEVANVMHEDALVATLRTRLSVIDGMTAVSKEHVCATAWVLSPGGDHVLLVRHRTLGWSTPGGHVHRDETTLTAARRELVEECGTIGHEATLVDPNPAFVHVTDVDDDTAGAHRHWNVGWHFTLDPRLTPSGSEQSRWWPCDELPTGPADLAVGVALLRAR